MKITIPTAFRTKALAFAALLCVGSANVQAQFIDFTDNVKVVFKTVDVVNSAGETVSAVQATGSVTSTDASGTITSKLQTFVQVADGVGGVEQIVTQETATATVDSFSGNYSVSTITKTRTTPVDASGTATGSTTVATTIADLSDVEEGSRPGAHHFFYTD